MFIIEITRKLRGVNMGEKIKKPFYKKWWFWVIIVIVVIFAITDDDTEDGGNVGTGDSAVASGQVGSESEGDNSAEDAEDENDAEDEPEEQSEYAINDKIDFEGRILEVTDVEYSQGNDFDTPSEGKEYVIVSVSIENTSDKEISYSPIYFEMRNSQGQIEGRAITIVDSDTSLSTGDLAPGGNVSGTIAFEQPIDDEDLTLLFEPSLWSSKRVEIKLK